MKICINNSCKAELEDYMDRCPNCGRLQKHIGIPAEELKPKEVVPERHGFITFWLWVIILVNIFMAIISFFPKQMWGNSYPDAYVMYSVISGLFCIVNIVGAFVLLSWKKIGFKMIVLSVIINGIFSFLTVKSLPTGIIGLLFLWWVLRIKKNGVSYWDSLD